MADGQVDLDYNEIGANGVISAGAKLGASQLLNGGVHAAVAADALLYVMVVAILVFVVIEPPIYSPGILDFWRNAFQPRTFVRGWIIWFLDMLFIAMVAAAGIVYAWDYQFYFQTNWLLTTNYLFVIFIIMRYLWKAVFYNFHHYRWMLVLSCLMSLFEFALSIVLMGLYAAQNAWYSMVAFIVVIIVLFALTCWNMYICYCFWTDDKSRCPCHWKRHQYAQLGSPQQKLAVHANGGQPQPNGQYGRQQQQVYFNNSGNMQSRTDAFH